MLRVHRINLILLRHQIVDNFDGVFIVTGRVQDVVQQQHDLWNAQLANALDLMGAAVQGCFVVVRKRLCWIWIDQIRTPRWEQGFPNGLMGSCGQQRRNKYKISLLICAPSWFGIEYI